MVAKKGWAFAAVLLLGMLGTVRAAGPLDSRVPADALFYFGWQGADDLSTDYAQSNLKSIIDNSKIPAYLNENWPIWMAKAKEGDAESAKKVEDVMIGLNLLYRHTTAVYVGPVGFADPNKPSFKVAILCEAGGDAATLEEWAKRMLAENPAPEEARARCIRKDSLVVFMLGDARAEDFAGTGGGLAAAPAYKAATASLMHDRAITFYIDAQKAIGTLQEALQKDENSTDDEKKMVPLIIKALGLNGLTQMAYAGGFENKEWREQAFVGARAPRTGILGLLDGGPISDDSLKLIPRDVAAFSVGRLDPSKVFAIIRETIKQYPPEDLKSFDKGLASFREEVGVDLEKEIIAPLGDEWVVYRGPKDDAASRPFVIVHKPKDSATFAKTVETLTAKYNSEPGNRMQVEKLDTGMMEVSGIRTPAVTVAWTIRGGYLYISTLEGIASAVEQVEKKGEAITANPDFIKIRDSLPKEKAVSISFNDPAKIYPEVYRSLMDMLPLARMVGLEIPGDLLPDPKKTAPFMLPGGNISWVDADGLHMVGRSSFPGAGAISGQISGPAAVGFTAMGVAVLLPSLSKARELANRSVDAANLRGITSACIIYSAEHNDAYPDHVGQLLLDGMAPKLLVSRRAGTTPLELTDELKKLGETDFEAFCKKVDEHCDFVYLGKGMKNESDASVIVAYEKPGPHAIQGINLAFQDAHVEFILWKGVADVFKDTNTYLKKNGLTEVDVDALVKAAPGHHEQSK